MKRKVVLCSLFVKASLTRLDLSYNQLCGIDRLYGTGTYTAEGIKAVADAIGVSASLTSLNLRDNNLASETGYIKATEVQGSS